MATTLGVAVIGAGTVGKGVIDNLREQRDLLASRCGCAIELVRAADLDTGRLKSIGVPEDRITGNAEEAIRAEGVDAVVELIGGTAAAYDIVDAALDAGKAVVTANKALLAERGGPLFAKAQARQAPLFFEAAVCGGMPVIRAIRDGLVADRLQHILGIVNGTCNYILTQMEDGRSYNEALAQAQRLGYAEADPTFDIEGVDSAHKLAILSSLAFDSTPSFPELHVEGITGLVQNDVAMADEMGYIVKLLAVARPQDDRIFLSVHPALIPKNHPLAGIDGTMNAVSFYGDRVLEGMFCGRGAGETPTASAVVSDLAEIARAHASGIRQMRWLPAPENRYALASMEDYRCRYFLRFSVQDRPGVLGRIASILGEENVSVASAIQKERCEGPVPLVLVTHEAREGDVRAALRRIDALEFAVAPAGMLRVEG